MRDHLFTHTHRVTDECLCGPTIPPPFFPSLDLSRGKKQDWRSKIKKIQLAL